MEVVGLAASIAALINVTAKTIKYLNSVTEASDDRLRLSAETSSLLPLLIDLQNQVNRRSNGEAWFDCVRSLGVKNGPIDQLREALVQLTEKVKLKSKSGLKNLTRAFVWPFDQDYCDGMLAKIERAKSRISLAVQQDTFALGQATKADTARLPLIDERVSTIAHHTEKQQINEQATHQKEILEWLSPLNFFTTQQDTITRREEGTGQWLLDSSEFKHWLSGADRTLCCPGIPGAGKSVLASIVVDFLRTPPVKHDSIGVAAIYCNFKERDQQSPENLLASCCVQVIQPSRDPLREVFTDVYRKHDSGRTRPSWEDIVRVFQDSINNLDTVYLVVDALDECLEDTRKILLDYFRSLPANTRLLATTRHIAEITDEFYHSPKVEIRADPVDLRVYITTRIAGNRRLEGYVLNDSSLKTHICDRVTTKADGMFLAAKLHVDSLSTKTSVRMLKKALEDLSNDLNVLYNDALIRIESQNQDDRKLAKDALRWVAHTYSPLTARALREALAIKPGDTDFDHEAMPTISLVLNVCAGLIILDQETQMVRLVHYTAQDFLDQVQTSEFGKAHAVIASNCIRYLSYECFQHPKDPSGHGTEGSSKESSNFREASSSTSTSPIKFAFLGYASNFWAQHAMANQHADLSIQINQFLAGNPRVILEKHSNNKWRIWETPTYWLKPCHSLQIAAFFGFCDELEGFLKKPREVNASIDDLNLLHLAARNDQASAIQILLDHGADVERRQPKHFTPLHRACCVGALKAATTLVNSGADVNSQDVFGRTALHFASQYGNVNLVNQLLSRGTHIDARDCRRNTALHYAATANNENCFPALLRGGADINWQGFLRKTALHKATLHDNLPGVKILLAYGANTEVQDDRGRTPLILAAEEKREDCALAILRNGADANAQDKSGMTALHVAIIAGSLSIKHELCKHHATIGTKSRAMFTLKYLTSSRRLVYIPDEYRERVLETSHDGKVQIATLTAFSLENPWQLRYLLSRRKHALEIRLYKEGVTALDIAVLGQHEGIVRWLESSTQSATECKSVVFEEYLFELLGVSSATEAEEALEQRIEKEHKGRTEEQRRGIGKGWAEIIKDEHLWKFALEYQLSVEKHAQAAWFLD